jgi:hypothetical protein
MAAAAAAVAAAEAEVDDASYAADANDGQLSPFADADWRFDYDGPGSPNAAHAAAQQQSLMNQTFPDSPQFRTGRVFEIPADAGFGMPTADAAAAGAALVGRQQPVHHGSPMHLAAAQAGGYGAAVGLGGMQQGPLPLAQLQLLQQQQEVGWLGMQNGAEVRIRRCLTTETADGIIARILVRHCRQCHCLLSYYDCSDCLFYCAGYHWLPSAHSAAAAAADAAAAAAAVVPHAS